ncbi:MAG: hypothetical protein ACRED1_10150, partial [Limisphaerales bacterium]
MLMISKGLTTLTLICSLATMSAAALGAPDGAIYLDPSRPVDERVADLLSRMTLDEKIGQMTQADLDCVTNLSDIQRYG